MASASHFFLNRLKVTIQIQLPWALWLGLAMRECYTLMLNYLSTDHGDRKHWKRKNRKHAPKRKIWLPPPQEWWRRWRQRRRGENVKYRLVPPSTKRSFHVRLVLATSTCLLVASVIYLFMGYGKRKSIDTLANSTQMNHKNQQQLPRLHYVPSFGKTCW